MRPLFRLVAALVTAVTITVGSATLIEGVHADDGSGREWNQIRGGAARDGWTALAPLSSEPTIAWRSELPGPILCEPVTWAGTCYVIAKDKKDMQLIALHARTGKELTRRKLKKSTWAHAATWQGRVIVCKEGTLESYPLKDGKLGSPWRKKGDFAGAPLVYAGHVFVRDGREIKVFEANRGKELASTAWLPKDDDEKQFMGFAMLTVRETDKDVTVAGAYHSAKDGKLYLHTHKVSGLGTKKVSLGIAIPRELMPLKATRDPEFQRKAILGWFKDDLSTSWLFTAPVGAGASKWAGSMAVHVTETRKKKQSSISTLPAAMGGEAFGFGSDTSLYRLSAKRKERSLTERGSLPQGARPGPAVASSGVVCFGNWAMEIESGRTMWCLPDLPEIQTVTPVADGFVLLGTETNELVCLAEPDRIVSQAEGDDATAATGSETGPPPPAEGDGVLLADGRKITGTAELNPDEDAFRVTPADGEAFEVSIDEVALIEVDGEVEWNGEEPAVLRAWQTVIDGVFARGLLETFELYRKERLLTECRRVLNDARTYGASPRLIESLEAGLTGKTENPNPKLKMKRLRPEETKRRKAAVDQVFTAIDWCKERDYGGAATALLQYASREKVDPARVESTAKELIPESFPWADADDASKRWITWANEIVPAGGEFLHKSSGHWNHAKRAPWNEDTIALVTKNMLLFSRTDDLRVVGMCLRTGEGTVRALENILGKGAANLRLPLQVKLHKNRKDYLEEKTPHGSAMPWSAGYYSPAENVSRFYVPDPARSVEPLGRGLSKTLAHEMTHHWLSMRWIPKSEARRHIGVPGYWIVEGFARYVEDQAVEMGRRRGRMDDTTVSSLDATSQVAKQEKLWSVPELLEMNQAAFAKIPEERVAVVELRNTVGNRVLDKRALFYEQSGSMVFFMMTMRGEEGRDALIKYMRLHYTGRSPSDPADRFGFDDGKALHAAFETFLRSLLE